MKYISIDDYNNIEQYNESLQALKNNNIQYAEYINTKTPFNFIIELEKEPIMVNYDLLPDNQLMYMVNKVEPANPREDYILERREAYDGVKGLKQYGLNAPLREADKSDYACFFNIRNKEQGLELSKNLGKIYYFGKYIKNTKVALCTNKMIKNYISPEHILSEKTKSVFQMEIDLNYKYFRLQNRLRKFTNTPYFYDGNFHNVNIKQFNFTL